MDLVLTLPAAAVRPATPADREFVYRVRSAALGDYIQFTWGWDEALQRHAHDRAFDPRRLSIVAYQGVDVGYIDIGERQGAVWLDQICLLPLYQRRGIGTALLRAILAAARERRLPVRLQVPRATSVGRFYRRLGFRTVDTSQHHDTMEYL